MLKKELRSGYTLRRQNISIENLENYSLDISSQLLKLPIWGFEYYHIFLPIIEKKEINTCFIISSLQGKDKNIVLPKMEGGNGLINYLFTDRTVIKKNKWGVPEPVDGSEVPAEKIDVVFLPLLAFDRHGNRVGYGKGFYDNFLKECRHDILKIGLSLFEAEDEISDVHENDVPMDYCVTPNKIYEF